MRHEKNVEHISKIGYTRQELSNLNKILLEFDKNGREINIVRKGKIIAAYTLPADKINEKHYYDISTGKEIPNYKPSE